MRRVPFLAWTLALALAVLTLAATLAAYQARPPWTLDVGDLGDHNPFSGLLGAGTNPDASPFIQGFYGDERDNDYRYRWTGDHATLTLPGLGQTSVPLILTLRVQGYRPAPMPPPAITVTVNGGWQAVVPLTTTMQAVTLGPVTNYGSTDPLVITLDSPTFTPPGDNRALGVKVDRLTVTPTLGSWIMPPLPILLSMVVSVLGLFALGWRGLRRRTARVRGLGAVGGALAGLALLLIGLQGAGLFTTWALPGVALVLGVLGLVAAGWERVQSWPRWIDDLVRPRNRVAPLLLALLLTGYGLAALWLLPQVDWIGHADYADNAVVARNLAAGRGYVVDYIAQFYHATPGITHPANTWPTLQPTLIAPFFVLFGPQTWAARLPNLLLLLALAVTVYACGTRWWDRRVGLLGAAFTLLHPYFFQTVLYPINDLAFTLFALLTVALAWEAAGGQGRGEGARGFAPPHAPPATPAAFEAQLTGLEMEEEARQAAALRRQRGLLLALGAVAGLLVWSKPTGAVLLVGLAVALWLRPRLVRWAGRRPSPARSDAPDGERRTSPARWRWLWLLVPFLLVLLPMLLRNLLTFGVPYYSTESLDAWILRYIPYGEWEKIYAIYTAPGQELPQPRWLLGGSFDALFAAVGRGFRDVWDNGVISGAVLPLPLFLAGAVGWLLAPRRLYGLLGAALGGFVLLEVSILLLWHYEARYFLALVPWFYLGVAALLFWLWDMARAPRPPDVLPAAPGRWATLLLPLALVLILAPALTNRAETGIVDVARAARGPDGFAIAGRWLAAHTPPDAVIMARDPWELNWYSQRQVVMIPWGSVEEIRQVARQYGVTHLWLGGPLGRKRPQLAPLYDRQPLPGLSTREVYHSDEGGYQITIYAWEP